MSDNTVITPDMTIHEVLTAKPAAAQVLMSVGMHCLGCAMARGETIEEAAMVHNQDVYALVEKLNAVK